MGDTTFIMLRLYVDTADRGAAEPLLASGLFHGLTTNPTLLQRESLRLPDLADLHGWATAAGAREVFFQSWGEDAAEIVRNARRLQEIGAEVVVKVAATRAGVPAARALVDDGNRVLLTAAYTASQGLVAAAVGAHYVAPYLGRMGDAGRDGLAEVLAMHRAITATGGPTKVLVASIRDLDVVVDLAQAGVSCFALSPAVAGALLEEPLTEAAVEVFESAARGLGSWWSSCPRSHDRRRGRGARRPDGRDGRRVAVGLARRRSPSGSGSPAHDGSDDACCGHTRPRAGSRCVT